MTEDKRLSRRQSLKGIATTGALLGGIGLGTNTGAAFVAEPRIKPYGVDPCKGKAQFQVYNNDRETRTFYYKVEETGEDGKITVKSDGATEFGYFWVKAPEGQVTVKMYDKGKKKSKKDKKFLDSATSDPTDVVDQGVDADDIDLELLDVKKKYKDEKDKKKAEKGHKTDGKQRYAKLKATNDTDGKVGATWQVEETGETGFLCLSADSATKFTVPLPKKGGTVRLHYGDSNSRVEI